MEIERAELGVDGNCGFALLGENIQEGEAEFEEFLGDIRKDKMIKSGPHFLACQVVITR